jgi:pSer/pThr/pTyr-binding forkhead associated (FHA) protein
VSVPARLVWERPDGARVEFPLEAEGLVVGRDAGADIVVEEALVSRRHARIERRSDAWYVVDLDSTNLTRVNGEAVRERQLVHGDEVRFARARCLFFGEGRGPDRPASGGDG